MFIRTSYRDQTIDFSEYMGYGYEDMLGRFFTSYSEYDNGPKDTMAKYIINPNGTKTHKYLSLY